MLALRELQQLVIPSPSTALLTQRAQDKLDVEESVSTRCSPRMMIDPGELHQLVIPSERGVLTPSDVEGSVSNQCVPKYAKGLQF